MAAVDYFLKIDGIEGESQDDKHKNEIQIESFSWGMANKGSQALGGGGGAGKVNMGDLRVTKHVDKASAKILEACHTGKHLSNATLVCRKAGGSAIEFWKISLSDVLVSGFDTQAGMVTGRRMHEPLTVSDARLGADDAQAFIIPVERIGLNFSKIEVEYREQDSKGNAKGPVKAGWDVKANKKV